MKSIVIYLLLSLTFTTQACAASTHIQPNLLENIITDFSQQISKDWQDYKRTEYFSKQKPVFHYLGVTFDQSVVSDSTNIESRYIHVAEVPDPKGGYELNLLKITYPNLETSSTNYSKIINSPNKNLKGGTIFMGYTAKQCNKEIILIATPAVASVKMKSYFSHFQESAYLCQQHNRD